MKAPVPSFDNSPVEPLSLVIIAFKEGIVVYKTDFTITVQGALWPRQLKVASAMIELYKEGTK